MNFQTFFLIEKQKLEQRIRTGIDWLSQKFETCPPPCVSKNKNGSPSAFSCYTNNNCPHTPNEQTEFCNGQLLLNKIEKALIYINQVLRDHHQYTKSKKLEVFYAYTKNCKSCNLYKTRTYYVFGSGNVDTTLMFVGEAPGYEEDRSGVPFVGKPGALLNTTIEKAGVKREDVYISNVVKCCPVKQPNSDLRDNERLPTQEEIKACLDKLLVQIDIIQPKVICALGKIAALALLSPQVEDFNVSLSSIRGKEYKISSIIVVPTYHPSAVLKNPNLLQQFTKDIEKSVRLSKQI